MSMLQLHLTVFKEPRGFIKVLEFLFALLAFSTTVGFSTYFTFHANVEDCQPPVSAPVRKNVYYPFALDSDVTRSSLCSSPARTETFHFATDVAGAARFFVAIGVICMLYALLALAGYVLFNEQYTSNKRIPSVDFVVHACAAVLWLVASSAWAHGATTLKQGCDPRRWLGVLCDERPGISCLFRADDFSGSFGKLNVSLIFGFLNVFLWAANLWFLWKETPWYKPRPAGTPATSATPADAPSPGTRAV